MRVDEIMTSPVSVVRPDIPVKEVAALLVRSGFGAVPVEAADGKLVGIITEADLVAIEAAPDPRRHLRRDLSDDAPSPHTAADVMTSPVIVTRTGTDIADVIRIMLAEHLTRMPVLDEDNRLAGLVSRSDAVRPLIRPDVEIEADVRAVLSYWYPPERVEVRVINGEASIATPPGPTRPLVDHLIRAIPGVITVSRTPNVADEPPSPPRGDQRPATDVEDPAV
ncbi:CBS domain-containing protein [Pseudofrankia sp. DC12]|uniref:CBS domain-containing protein n=1 Tax=Pseudofrankia sp. DC12 TaxID=683315 RepID=UPI0006963AF4|nr:CBS domain-containing protein [Pseudofrankia sp. DC12]